MDGAWTASTGTGGIPVENPATEKVIAQVPAGTPAGRRPGGRRGPPRLPRLGGDRRRRRGPGCSPRWPTGSPPAGGGGRDHHRRDGLPDEGGRRGPGRAAAHGAARRTRTCSTPTSRPQRDRPLPGPARAGRRGRARSPRGTTRCTRPWPRWPPRWPPAAPSCSSRASSRRCPRTCSWRSPDDAGLPPGVLNLVQRHRAGGRRGAGRAPGRRHGVVHRLDARRPAGGARWPPTRSSAVALELGGKSANVILPTPT